MNPMPPPPPDQVWIPEVSMIKLGHAVFDNDKPEDKFIESHTSYLVYFCALFIPEAKSITLHYFKAPSKFISPYLLEYQE